MTLSCPTEEERLTTAKEVLKEIESISDKVTDKVKEQLLLLIEAVKEAKVPFSEEVAIGPYCLRYEFNFNSRLIYVGLRLPLWKIFKKSKKILAVEFDPLWHGLSMFETRILKTWFDSKYIADYQEFYRLLKIEAIRQIELQTNKQVARIISHNIDFRLKREE